MINTTNKPDFLDQVVGKVLNFLFVIGVFSSLIALCIGYVYFFGEKV